MADTRDADVTRASCGTFAGFPPSGHENCPLCDYPLTGLPSPYACPECGFEFDSDTYFVSSPYPRWLNFLLFAAIASQLWIVIEQVKDMIPNWDPGLLMFSLFPIWCTAMMVHTYRRRRQKPALLVIGPEGIAYRHVGRIEFTHVLLPDIVGFTLKPGFSRTRYVLHLQRRKDDDMMLPLPFFWKASQVRRLRENLTRRIGDRLE